MVKGQFAAVLEVLSPCLGKDAATVPPQFQELVRRVNSIAGQLRGITESEHGEDVKRDVLKSLCDESNRLSRDIEKSYAIVALPDPVYVDSLTGFNFIEKIDCAHGLGPEKLYYPTAWKCTGHHLQAELDVFNDRRAFLQGLMWDGKVVFPVEELSQVVVADRTRPQWPRSACTKLPQNAGHWHGGPKHQLITGWVKDERYPRQAPESSGGGCSLQ